MKKTIYYLISLLFCFPLQAQNQDSISTQEIRTAPTTNTDDHYFALSKNIDIFNSLLKQLNKHYVDSLKVDEVVSKGINSMLRNVDPYTTYIPEDKQKDFRFMTTGQYGGIGSLISKKGDYVVIQQTYEGNPAELSGLIAGDLILKIDKKNMKGKTTSEVSELLKGTPDTKLKIEVQRIGKKKPITVTITRKNIYLNPVRYYGMINDSIAYLQLTGFTDGCADEVEKAIIDLEQQGMTSLIFDLRSNPGGILHEASQICNLFLPKGETILTTRGKAGKIQSIYKTSNKPKYLDLPLIVLADDNSASASEIVAGALQDLDRAVIVGKRTYGKGLVQGTYPIAYNGKLKVTLAKYYIPSGRCIQEIDYATDKKNEEIPDSLTSEFKTRSGRIVRDGRGISPDITITDEKGKTISYYLMLKQLFFDYANQYYADHATIAEVDSFKLEDEDFEDFKQFILASDFNYDLQTESVLANLIKIAKEESYYERNKTEFDALEKVLTHEVEADIIDAKEDIMTILAYEIVERYYFQKGQSKQALKNDLALDKGVELLQDLSAYKKLLLPNALSSDDK